MTPTLAEAIAAQQVVTDFLKAMAPAAAQPAAPAFVSPLAGIAAIKAIDTIVLPGEMEAVVRVELAEKLNRPLLFPYVTKDDTAKEYDSFYRAQGFLLFYAGDTVREVRIKLKKPLAGQFRLNVQGSWTDPPVPGRELIVKAGTARPEIAQSPAIIRAPAKRAGGRALKFESNFLEPVSPTGGPGTWKSRFKWHRYQNDNREWGAYVDAATDPGCTPHPIVNGERRLRCERKPMVETFEGRQINLPWYASMMSTDGGLWSGGPYGYYEFERTIPQALCFTPAAWFLPTTNSWPKDGEFDWEEIFQYLSTGVNPKDSKTIHWTNPGDPSTDRKEAVSLPHGRPFDRHKLGLDVTPEEIVYFVDDAEVLRRPNLTFHLPWYFIANLAAWVPGAPPIPSTVPDIVEMTVHRFAAWG
jgi:hypothetical protein